MSFRIHCPECDIMFEPPLGVWSAQCPFCGKPVEVPQIRAGEELPGYRKRTRKGPGWWLQFQSHLPGWTNVVLAASFIFFLSSALIQAWLASHRQRSGDTFLRALESWNSAISARNDADTVKAGDRLLGSMRSEAAKKLAETHGLLEPEIRSRRRDAARADWDRRFTESLKKRPEGAFESLKELRQEAKSDEDLASSAQKAANAWSTIRSDRIQASLTDFEAAFAKGETREAWRLLKQAEIFSLLNFDDESGKESFRGPIAQAATRIAGRYGMTVAIRLNAKTFATEESVRTRVLPLIEDRARKSGYLIEDLKDPEVSRKFREASRYRLEIEISERFGRPYEDTPHRTTILEFDFVLKTQGEADERRNAVVRTPRLPAKTAIGMSRLQLAKQSDERVERNLEEAAWDSIEGPVSQAVGSLPQPR